MIKHLLYDFVILSEEEKEYLLMVAGNLLHYQIETATDESELKYLKNIEDLI